jgi:RNA polymerase subunit RPABC4/transcription elongation factor Spt4
MGAKKVTCEECQADLTTTGNWDGFRIVLATESIPTWDGPVVTLAAR